jgi:hypothetical protein
MKKFNNFGFYLRLVTSVLFALVAIGMLFEDTLLAIGLLFWSIIFLNTTIKNKRLEKLVADMEETIKAPKDPTYEDQLRAEWANRSNDTKVMDYFNIIFGSSLSAEAVENYPKLGDFCDHHGISKEEVLSIVKENTKEKVQ